MHACMHSQNNLLSSTHVCVYILGPPSPVSSSILNSDACTATFVTISWDPVTSDPVCGPVSYDMIISSSDAVMMIRITDTAYNFTGLTPDKSYTVTVAGRNDAGVGEAIMKMFYKPTMEEAVPRGKILSIKNENYDPYLSYKLL